MATTTNTPAATPTEGWALITYWGYQNISVTRAAYRNRHGWVNGPGQDRAIITDSRVRSITAMRVAADDEVIVKRPAARRLTAA